MKQITLEQVLNQQFKKSEFVREWRRSEARYQVTRQLIKARMEQKVSQRDLAKKAQTTQAIISRLENLSFNPSLNLLERLAGALGKKLEVNLARV
jgi:ribosome-binding protein aMBF1 (putative translation factor)